MARSSTPLSLLLGVALAACGAESTVPCTEPDDGLLEGWWAERVLVECEGFALAVDSTGTPAVAWTAAGREKLYFSRPRLGRWYPEGVEWAERSRMTVEGLVFAAATEPLIGYSRRVPNDRSSWEFVLARRGEGDWTVERVVPDVGGGVRLAADSGGNLHMAYTGYPEYDIHHVARADGVWEDEVVGRAVEGGVGLAVGPEGAAHLVYEGPAGLEHATNSSGRWTAEVMDPTGIASRGWDPCAVGLGPDDVLHAACVAGPDLYYLTNASGGWTMERLRGERAIPSDADLAISASGAVHVSSFRQMCEGRSRPPCTFGLEWSTNESGEWVTRVVDVAAAPSGSSLAIGPDGVLHVAYSYWQLEGDDYTGGLRYATNGPRSEAVEDTCPDED